jgi:hypothetical protein
MFKIFKILKLSRFVVNRTILCSVDRASLYNFVNKANLVHNFFLVHLFLFCTCFGQLCAHHQEIQLYLCDTWYLLFCMNDYLLCRVESTLHNR